VKRSELFDKAASNRDSHHRKTGGNATPKVPRVVGAAPLPPIPATVTSSAVYTVETCPVSAACNKNSSGSGNTASTGSPQKSTIPAALPIRNIGTMIEKVEADLRSKPERVDAPRCVEILQNMYRPSLSPGLRLPLRLPTGGSSNNNNNNSSGMISRLGHHANVRVFVNSLT